MTSISWMVNASFYCAKPPVRMNAWLPGRGRDLLQMPIQIDIHLYIYICVYIYMYISIYSICVCVCACVNAFICVKTS